MGSDMMVALKEASANRTTLFGVNHYAAPNERQILHMAHGHHHENDEVSPLAHLNIPQARQTFSSLGVQPRGEWGYFHGVNEHRVAVGVTDWHSRLASGAPALGGPDLVRLALERSHSAHHAVEVVTDLLERCGHASESSVASSNDHIYLIADRAEAYVLETCGRYWALLECGHSRVVTDVALIRQDWRRLAPGLADFVHEKGWAEDDGSKIDFVGSLGDESPDRSKNAQKRWGRASLALSQQQGAIDLHFLRRMLADHYTANRDLLPNGKGAALASSFLTDLHSEPALMWVSFGTPKVALHFPICLAGELPAAFAEGLPTAPTIQEHTQELCKLTHGKDRAKLEGMIERVQTKFDQDAEDLVVKCHQLSLLNQSALIAQLATEMMQHHVDLFDQEYRRLLGLDERAPQMAPEAEEMLFFA